MLRAQKDVCYSNIPVFQGLWMLRHRRWAGAAVGGCYFKGTCSFLIRCWCVYLKKTCICSSLEETYQKALVVLQEFGRDSNSSSLASHIFGLWLSIFFINLLMIPLGHIYQQSAGESIHRKDISKIRDTTVQMQVCNCLSFPVGWEEPRRNDPQCKKCIPQSLKLFPGRQILISFHLL